MDLVLEWAWQAVSLFAGTFVHEDAAVLAGAYLVVQKGLPAGLAFGALAIGVVLGDLLIYAIGRFASRIGWFSRATRKLQNSSFGELLDRRLLFAIAAARIVPTMAFPVFAACGAFRISFARFFIASVATGIIYVAVVFGLLLLFGKSLPSWASNYGWIGIFVLVAAVWALRRFFLKSPIGDLGAKEDVPFLNVHKGMPPLPADKVRVSLQERLPTVPFYVPQTVQWAWLALRHWGLTLPTAANPHIPTGGLLGESKAECLDLVSGPQRRRLARATDAVVVEDPSDISRPLAELKVAAANAGLDFPMMVKPDMGWRGFGVRLVENETQLAAYLEEYPAGAPVILQQYVPWHGEAAIFYVREPGQPEGRIFSMTFRYFPFVIGDGEMTLRDLILDNSRLRWRRKVLLNQHAHQLGWVPEAGEEVRLAVVGSNRVGGLYVDAGSYVTPELTAEMDRMAKSMPEFWFGRFDVRFETVEQLQAGDGYMVVEINGAGSEAVHIWDPDLPLTEVYRVLFEQQSLMFRIGAANRRRGFRPMGAMDLIGYGRRHNRLLQIYPPSS